MCAQSQPVNSEPNWKRLNGPDQVPEESEFGGGHCPWPGNPNLLLDSLSGSWLA